MVVLCLVACGTQAGAGCGVVVELLRESAKNV